MFARRISTIDGNFAIFLQSCVDDAVYHMCAITTNVGGNSSGKSYIGLASKEIRLDVRDRIGSCVDATGGGSSFSPVENSH